MIKVKAKSNKIENKHTTEIDKAKSQLFEKLVLIDKLLKRVSEGKIKQSKTYLVPKVLHKETWTVLYIQLSHEN